MTRTLGVTGGIGSGKSTVCEILESFGARIFRADEEGKRLMTEDHQIRHEVTISFGVDSYTLGGELNTEYLSKKVFADQEHVAAINAIVHPRVLKAFEDASSMARKDGINLLVLESALLFQSGGYELVDYVMVVDAPIPTRVSRVVERDDVTPKDVKARMNYQLSSAELRKRADFVIHNRDSIESLTEAVAEVYHRIITP